MDEQDLDRNEAATPYKLEKAREKGQAARSADVVSATVFAAGMAFIAWQGWELTSAFLQLARQSLATISLASTPSALFAQAATLAGEAGRLLAPLLVVLALAAILASVVHTGPIWSLQPLQPDLQRLDPVAGLRRLFSWRTLFDAVRSLVKLAALLAVAWWAVIDLLPQMPALATLPPLDLLRTLVRETGSVGLQMSAVLGLIAAADLLFTRRDFASRMRMSRRELKDEHKQREGDPRIRSRLRQLRQEMRKRSLALRSTRDADVLLTNPTHFAVALRYDHGQMDAPQLVAKGAGQLAAAMRDIARRHQIAIVPSPSLTRRLFRGVELGQSLPPQFHTEVARIVVWVFAMRARRAADGRSPA